MRTSVSPALTHSVTTLLLAMADPQPVARAAH
jgi:hypothetical protein